MSQSILDTVIGTKSTSGGGSGDPEAAAAHYAKAVEALDNGDRVAAVDELRQAAQLDDKAEYLFKLAYLLDLLGEEDEAMSLYERLVHRDQPHIHALLNLAVLCEDRGETNRAERYLRQILDTDPNHPRARMYMKDVLGSKNMYYDEEAARDLAKRSAMLDIPVTDFELSVRARNCLKKMQIRTLGDLLRITEAELLAYKNFGETSLVEIKAMLAQKGLRLGQGVEGTLNRARREIYNELKGKASEAILARPISVLDLSVRARKALQMLGIQTLGDLAMRTEAELMGVKNFGATSLVEIREKLTEHGLGLRTLD